MLDERDMLSNKPNSKKNDSKEKKNKLKVPAKIDDTKQASSADDDYIVFQFKEDGGIDLVEEKSPPGNQAGLIAGRHQKHKVQ